MDLGSLCPGAWSPPHLGPALTHLLAQHTWGTAFSQPHGHRSPAPCLSSHRDSRSGPTLLRSPSSPCSRQQPGDDAERVTRPITHNSPVAFTAEMTAGPSPGQGDLPPCPSPEPLVFSLTRYIPDIFISFQLCFWNTLFSASGPLHAPSVLLATLPSLPGSHLPLAVSLG